MIYYFIENLTEINPETQFELERNVVIKNLSNENLDYLKFNIKSFYSDFASYFKLQNDFQKSFHEYKIVEKMPKGGVGIAPRDKKDFRYFVIEDAVASKFNMLYHKAFALADNDFYIPFSFGVNNGNNVLRTLYSQLAISTYYNDKKILMPMTRNPGLPQIKEPKTINADDIEDIKECLKTLKRFELIKSEYQLINKALEDFFLVEEISDFSQFKIVAYMACLELLLVDSKFDRVKAISAQLPSKLTLLNNQFRNPIIISDYIKVPDTMSLGKVIELLYAYRSTVAHGNLLSFDKKMQPLEKIDEPTILALIKEILKKTLRFAIENPQLLKDLKEC